MTDQRGNVGPVMVVLVMFAVAAAAAVADAGLYLAAGVQAATAADAAALAAAPLTFREYGSTSGPVFEAARLAASNGTSLVSCSCPVDPSWRSRTVTVVVEKSIRTGLFGERAIRAVGRAEFDPMRAR